LQEEDDLPPGEDEEDPSDRSNMAVLWDSISTYFIETSVHGLKYIVDESSQIWEKLFWSIVVSLGLTIAGKMSCLGVLAWDNLPLRSNIPLCATLDTYDF
jgi:hypothetical protein